MTISDNAAFEQQLGFLSEAIKEWLKGEAFTDLSIEREGQETDEGNRWLGYIPFDYAKVTLSLEGRAVKRGRFKMVKGLCEFLEDLPLQGEET